MYQLNQTDREFLYKKYISLGLTPKESYKNIKQLTEHLRFLVEKLKAKKRTEQEIRDKIRLEFERKYMEIEGKF